MILQVLVACIITTLVSTQEIEGPLQSQFNASNSSAEREAPEYPETTDIRTNKEQGLTADNRKPLSTSDKTGYNSTDDVMLNKVLRNTDKDYEGTEEHRGQGATNHNDPVENVSFDPVIGNSDSERTVSSNVPGISVSSVWSRDIISTGSNTGYGQSEERSNGASSTAISTLTFTFTNESSSPKGREVTVTTELRNTSVASEISYGDKYITGDNSTDDVVLNEDLRKTDRNSEVTEERHGQEAVSHDQPVASVFLTSNPVTDSVDSQRTVSNIESDTSISTVRSYDNISTEGITGDGPSDERRKEDSSTVTSTTVNESSIPNGHDVNVTTEFNNTSVTSGDDDNFMTMIQTAAYKLYVGAAVVFGVCLLATIVVGLTVWKRRQRELRREYELKRISQRSQIPQMEKLYSMAAFAAATDGADASRTMTRTATVGRRPQGPRPVVTAASMPLLDNSNAEDLAQIRKEMFSDVRTWAPERRVSNPPSRNFFK